MTTPPATFRRPRNRDYLLALVVVFPFLLLAGLAGCVGLFSAAAWGQSVARGLPGVLLTAVALLAGFPAVVSVHELGHAAAARAVGWPITAFRVGPAVWERRGGRWVWCVNWRANWWSGGVVVAPGPTTRWRTALFSLAGPAVNLACGPLLLVGLANGLPGWVRCAAVVFAAWSLMFGAGNLIPLRERGLDTDGATLLKLWLNPWWAGPPNATATRGQAGLPPLS